jgi:hypothetical protein
MTLRHDAPIIIIDPDDTFAYHCNKTNIKKEFPFKECRKNSDEPKHWFRDKNGARWNLIDKDWFNNNQ